MLEVCVPGEDFTRAKSTLEPANDDIKLDSIHHTSLLLPPLFSDVIRKITKINSLQYNN